MNVRCTIDNVCPSTSLVTQVSTSTCSTCSFLLFLLFFFYFSQSCECPSIFGEKIFRGACVLLLRHGGVCMTKRTRRGLEITISSSGWCSVCCRCGTTVSDSLAVVGAGTDEGVDVGIGGIVNVSGISGVLSMYGILSCDVVVLGTCGVRALLSFEWFFSSSVLLIVISFVAGVMLDLRHIGSIFLRKRRFLRVILRLPSTITRYWRCGSAPTIMPVLCHLFGRFPCWFWICTLSPISSGLKLLWIGV